MPASVNSVEARESAVNLARLGQVEDAYQQLLKLHREAGRLDDLTERRRLRFDLAVVAAWAGYDLKVRDLLADLKLADIPAYVLEPYAKSLRNLRQWQDAADVYRYLLGPLTTAADDAVALYRRANLQLIFGLSLTLSDADQFEGARSTLDLLDAEQIPAGEMGDYYFACGYIEERARNFLGALDCYNHGLRVAPAHEGLQRRRIRVASSLGATQFASAQLVQHPDIVSPREGAQIALDVGAMQIRWATLEQQTVEREHQIEALIAKRQRLETVTAIQARVRIYDDIVAHTAIAQMNEATTKARSLFSQGHKLAEFPAYVLEALGYAYMYQERPERAIRCFELALSKHPLNGAEKQRFRVSVGLFYALSDAQRFHQVSDLVARLKAAEQPWERPTEKIWLANDRYTDSVHLAALADAYRENYHAALLQLDHLLSIAPANNQLRLSRAAVSRWRGWHDRSLDELERLPRDQQFTSKWVQMTHIGLETQRYEMAADSVERAIALNPRDKAVLDVQARWQRHNRPVLEVNASAGRSDGGQLGNESLGVDSSYYSAPIAEHFRIYARGSYRYAEFVEGLGRDTRAGLGLEYRAGDLTLAGDVQSGLDQFSGVAATLSAALRVGDRWQHSMQLHHNSVETPLRGVRQGVEGDLLRYGVRYRWYEGREVSLAVASMDLSDSNHRAWLDLRIRQRIANWPKHKLNVSAGYYRSRSDRDQVAYFSPRRDEDMGLDMEHEWRPWRRYERAFVQRLTVGVGRYQQKNFGSNNRWSVSLEHEWRLNDGWNIGYGLSYARRPYDGIQEKQRSIFLNLRGHL